MSYDIWLEMDTGSEERAQVCGAPGNCTYNVDPMFALALDKSQFTGLERSSDILFGGEPALKRFVGKQAGACIDQLESAVYSMKADPAPFEALNPDNGWGDYDGALSYLQKFLAACEEHPKATIGAWL